MWCLLCTDVCVCLGTCVCGVSGGCVRILLDLSVGWCGGGVGCVCVCVSAECGRVSSISWVLSVCL